MNKASVAIVGAGVAGLSCAWLLARQGWQVTLYEKAENLRSHGYMLGLSGPGFMAAEQMGILDTLRQCDRPVFENRYLDKSGAEILRIRYQQLLGSVDWLTLSRTQLVDTLYQRLCEDTDVSIRFATTVSRFNNSAAGVELHLCDGSQQQVDLLIGADGVHSKIRQQLLAEQPTPLEYLGYRVAAFQGVDSLGLEDDFVSFAQPGKLSEYYRLADNRMAGLYAWKDDDTARPADRQQALEILRQRFSDANPKVQHCLETVEQDSPLLFDSLAMVILPSWSKQRVLLMGDAAHCLTLLSGQGAGMAMRSALLLAEKLASEPIEAALASHEKALRPSIERIQQRSRDIAPWFIPATEKAFKRRNWLLKWLPKRFIGWYFLRAIKADMQAAGSAN